uniref:Uncharacterized protein n=1 Tax=Rousettus aegyptiacus TaxID=9407 RepID=A0A7J8ILL3_ROUAE|nr:hypothetical protein HJG63_010702 [Rousettus aegyptiacus]
MKNTLFEVRSMLNGINKVNREEDHMTYTEDEKTKDTQSEWQGKKNSQDYNNSLRSLWDTIIGKNIHVNGVPERKQYVEELYEEIMMENVPNLLKEIDIKPQEAQTVPQTRNPKEVHTKTHHNLNAKG